MSTAARRVAVIGGGWAGLAAAVEATAAGGEVTLYETARQWGGRARAVAHQGPDGEVALDNGQHILIGAYVDTLALMRRVGVVPDALLWRSPLKLIDPHGRGLSLPPGPPMLAFLRGVLANRHWSASARLGLLMAACGWALRRFRCAPQATVADLAASVPAEVRHTLIEPLCAAALNTPADRASGQVFLRVLHDALFSGPGCADLLLPQAKLSALLPEPAAAWLADHGATLRCGHRVQALEADGARWRVDGEAFDGVVLACSAKEAARLAAPHASSWAGRADAFEYEPIITVYLRGAGRPWPAPMVALASSDAAPAQFAFDLGAIGPGASAERRGLYAFVVSGARPWVERGLDACEAAVLRQAVEAFPAGQWTAGPNPLTTFAEKRATFACTPGLMRPASAVAPGLVAAGDYVDGPYPATIEGAVRAGRQAASQLF